MIPHSPHTPAQPPPDPIDLEWRALQHAQLLREFFEMLPAALDRWHREIAAAMRRAQEDR